MCTAESRDESGQVVGERLGKVMQNQVKFWEEEVSAN